MEHEEQTTADDAAAPALETELPDPDDLTSGPQALDDPDSFEDVPPPPRSGDEAVDAAAAELAQALREPLELQVQAYEKAQRTLQDRLADVES